eukprot:CAMPEP_0181114072 /NCGR_PEP_ID=MMETSP1071-20121207/20683_1 /TAXON_ID=35127 /ORGANISM="Thalassiosira sp., Strain NH16" /LENGTH=203 /DNA_ID=CAMNT_0023198147 /DNA_START=107 /DNA_END=715 /DNA_ORIENTATION=+
MDYSNHTATHNHQEAMISSPDKIHDNAISGANRVADDEQGVDLNDNDEPGFPKQHEVVPPGIIELMRTSNLHPSQISPRQHIDSPLQYTQGLLTLDGESIKNRNELGSENQHSFQASSQVYLLSPPPRGCIEKEDAAPISSSLSHDTLTLALLYHSSRRSRHNSPQSLVGSSFITHPIKAIPLPPFTTFPSSSAVDSQQHQVW